MVINKQKKNEITFKKLHTTCLQLTTLYDTLSKLLIISDEDIGVLIVHIPNR